MCCALAIVQTLRSRAVDKFGAAKRSRSPDRNEKARTRIQGNPISGNEAYAMLISELFGSSLLCMAVLTCMLTAGVATAQTSTLQGNVGIGPVPVTTKFGGQIFGLDIDQHGTEGILTEASFLEDGRILAAVETFDQATGKILRVIKQVTSKDDFITLGIAGA